LKLTREFYIPKDAKVQEFPELSAVAYIGKGSSTKNADKPWLVCFSGKRQKPDLNYLYHSTERMEKALQEWLDGLKRNQEYKEQRKAEKTGLAEPAHSAKVLKGHLQKFFPGVKFSVKSDTFSMGCSIDVSYTDGPLKEEVEAIADLFQYGRFDGMQDLSYSVKVHVPGCHGAKYVHVNRKMSAELKTSITDILNEQFCPHHGDRGFAPYQWSEAERIFLGVTAAEITQRNQERINIVLGRENTTPQNALESSKNDTCIQTHQQGVESLTGGQPESHTPTTEHMSGSKNNIITVDFSKATKKQLWALHCITKLDTREWPLNREQADFLIKSANNGVDIIAELRKLAGV